MICGIRSDQCVESAVRDAADKGFYVHVPEDAIVTEKIENHKQALINMEAFARITHTDTLLNEIKKW